MKTRSRRKLLRFIELLLLCIVLNLAHTALAAETPFGFKIGESVKNQLPPCTADQPGTLCFELVDTLPSISTYKLRGEKNILGGIAQQVYLVERNDIIEQVQVVFGKEAIESVNQLLLMQFGPPQIRSTKPVWVDRYEYQANLSHWLLEDGVVSLQDTLGQRNLACAVIRTQEDFDKSMSPSTQALTPMRNI